MKPPKLTRESLDYFKERLDTLADDATPQWGVLIPRDMVKHVRTSMLLSMGQVEAPDLSSLFSRTVIKIGLLYLSKKIPQNSKGHSSLSCSSEASLHDERAALYEQMECFLGMVEDHPDRKSRHPYFGLLSMNEWAILHGIHLDHHLRQFGV
jgi:oxepin-CoA hydrolase / 3-oxo-5,6-dehydrosuberyl-CoA semialdehyde dehydrogenase